jgi:hypothetical protein
MIFKHNLQLNSTKFKIEAQKILILMYLVSSGMRLPMLHKNDYSKTLGQLSPLPSPFSTLSFFLLVVLEISRQMQRGEIFPTPPLTLQGADK